MSVCNLSTKSKLTCKADYVPESAERKAKWPHEVEQQPAKQSTGHTMVNDKHSEQTHHTN